MYKRAFMYSSNAPITLEESQQNETDENEDLTNKSTEINDDESEKGIDDLKFNSYLESETIRTHPGNKVSYCKFCKGKTFLNKDSIDKHLKSKNHIKNVKKIEKNAVEINIIKKQFLKRMKEVDNKSYDNTL